jgi:hypothetical protein
LERLFLEERVHEKAIMDASALVDPASSALRRSLDGLTSLYLSNALFCVKPANMKTTLSGTLRVVALVGLGLAAVLTFRATAQSPKTDNFELNVPKKQGEYWHLKNMKCDGQNQFIKLLNEGPYDKNSTQKLHFKKDPSQPECDLPGGCAPCTGSASPAQLNIKTDKVTVANAAQTAADGDPNVTIRVASTSPAAIKAVLDLLEEP